MKRIIVTGATSMIGTALIEECIRHDIEVYAVVRAGSSKTKRLPESARIHQIECELEKLEELPAKITGECDTFFHIAWGNTGENRNSSTELQSRNVFYTLKAVRAAHAMGCKRFIGAGSQAEYGPMDVPRIAPDSPVHPTTPYGASKLAANQLSFMLCKELGIEWIWPRIFSVYGIYEKETTMIASGLRKMLKGEKNRVYPCRTEMGLSLQQRCRARILSDRRKRQRWCSLLCGKRAGTSSAGIYHADGGTYRSGFTGNRRETISAGSSAESVCRYR